MRTVKKIITWILILGLLVTSADFGNISVQAASGKVSTSKYTISKKPGTYTDSVSITIKAKKGYKVYYTTGSKLSVKHIIKSGKSKKLKFTKTTTLKLYAVKKSTSITKKILSQKKVLKKAVSYKYKITRKDTTSTDNSNTTQTDNPGTTPENDSSSGGDTSDNSTDNSTATPSDSNTTEQDTSGDVDHAESDGTSSSDSGTSDETPYYTRIDNSNQGIEEDDWVYADPADWMLSTSYQLPETSVTTEGDYGEYDSAQSIFPSDCWEAKEITKTVGTDDSFTIGTEDGISNCEIEIPADAFDDETTVTYK
ncbi:MAG: hypothetical protein IJ801_09010 [Lachnospiraceae bacterium]|nr:hypothetical protein [Lachnospiraceae bacterium]